MPASEAPLWWYTLTHSLNVVHKHIAEKWTQTFYPIFRLICSIRHTLSTKTLYMSYAQEHYVVLRVQTIVRNICYLYSIFILNMLRPRQTQRWLQQISNPEIMYLVIYYYVIYYIKSTDAPTRRVVVVVSWWGSWSEVMAAFGVKYTFKPILCTRLPR